MAKRKSKKSAYTLNRERILSYVRAQARKGYVIELEYIPTEKQLKAQGIKGTELAKRTRELKKITSKELKQKRQDRYVDISETETLDTYTGEIHTQEPALSEMQIQTIIAQFKSFFSRYNAHCQYVILTWLNTTIESHGHLKTAEMIQNGMSNVNWDSRYAYDDSLLSAYIQEMMNYLPISSAEKDEIMRYVEDEAGLQWEEPM